MKIKIIKIDSDNVFFLSKYGQCYGKWKNEYMPTLGECSVEFDYPHMLNKQNIRKVKDDNTGKMVDKDEKILIVGKVDELEKGYISIKLGNDYIGFEIENNVALKQGDAVEIRLEEINIYDENVF